jgi:hypothetical protein
MIMDSQEQAVTESVSAHFGEGQAQRFASVFNDCTSSYKFLWCISLVEELAYTGAKELAVLRLLVRMLALAWQPIIHFRLSFGTTDSLQQLIGRFRTKLPLASDAPASEIISTLFASKDVSDECFRLARYVPTRFLKPWFLEALQKVPDSSQDSAILKLSQQSQNSPLASPYFFCDRGKNRKLVMNERWRNFLQSHSALVLGFVRFHLIRFLQARNPNVPGIVEKLEIPDKRGGLLAAKKFWKLIATRLQPLTPSAPLRCIYSGEELHSGVAIDHFLPWSFVAHDQLWNLIPTTVHANSSKGDQLPSLSRYLQPAASLHWRALCTLDTGEIPEDYCIALQLDSESIRILRWDEFFSRYEAIVRPQAQIARNLGFQLDWEF